MSALYSHTTRATGLVLTAAIYNADHQNHIDNGVPAQLDDYSVSTTQMRSTTDPGESGSESLATTLAGEIERIRFAIKECKGTTYWYETPASNLAASSTFGFDGGTAGGSADALTATCSPTMPSLADRTKLFLRAAAANATTTPTINPDSLGAKTIVKEGNSALAAGDIAGAGHELILIRHTSPDVWELLNPATSASAAPTSDVSNLLANGGFQIAQRGAGPFTSATTPTNGDDTYQIDRTIFLSNGADIADVSRQADANFASGYSFEIDIETSNTKCGIFIPLSADESKALIKAAKASLQFKAYQNNGTSIETLRAGILSWASTADTITSDVVSAWNAAGSDPTLVANWTFENTPSSLNLTGAIQTFEIANIDIDTASVAQCGIFIWIDDTSLTVGDKCRIGDISLVASESAVDFYPDNPTTALLKCQSFLYTTTKLASRSFGSGVSVTSTSSRIDIPFPTIMRITPTISVSAASDFQVENPTAGAVSSVSSTVANKDGIKFILAHAAVGGVGNGAILTDGGGAAAQIIATAEL